MDSMAVKVSVVVPVYNPGPYLARCVESLVGQSLPADEYEAIFVDDGSTDATPGRLDELAVRSSNVRVIHQPNSGWPGKPRNVGLDAARGEYVFFADDDDALGPEALERLWAMANRNGSDIVVGKMVGHGRGVPRVLFQRQRDRATLADTPLIDSLTPHKLFRRQFLIDEGLRFPEGRRRLEDHLFVVRAYFAASVISVLAEYDCYHHFARPDRANAGATWLEPAGYYANLREVLEVIESSTAPGPFRDSLLQRFARIELLNRLQGPRFLRSSPAYRARLFAEIATVLREHIPPSVDEGLPDHYRTRVALARAGRLDLLVAFNRASARVAGAGRLLELEWTSAARLRLAIEARLDFGRSALRFEGGPDRLILGTPAAIAAAIPDSARYLGSASAGGAALMVRRRVDSVEIGLPATIDTAVVPRAGGGVDVIHTIDVEIDPDTLVGRRLRDATWDVIALVWFLGIRLEAPVRVRLGSHLVGSVRPGSDRNSMRPFRTARGHLAVAIGRRSFRLRLAEARRLARPLRRAWAARSQLRRR